VTLTTDDKARAIAGIKGRDRYKAAFWRLALKLGRLPTTRDKAYWELPPPGAKT
jgi:hypothetical protein